MKHQTGCLLLALSVVMVAPRCGAPTSSQTSESTERGTLVGAWRSQIEFRDGTLAEVKDLEFLYAYNAGGTMTESSNYDEAANSSPPAYGVWRKTGAAQFETRYVFYTTRAPVAADGPANSGSWLPSGYGVLTEIITLSHDGRTYTSTIHFDAFDKNGKPATGGGDGRGAGTRIRF